MKSQVGLRETMTPRLLKGLYSVQILSCFDHFFKTQLKVRETPTVSAAAAVTAYLHTTRIRARARPSIGDDRLFIYAADYFNIK